MAFTDTEKTLIREYLGWGARFGQTDSALEGAMSAVEAQPSDETRARAHLTELARIDTAIAASENRLKASVVGSITLNARELSQLRSRGKERVGRLARLFGVEVRGDAFNADTPNTRGSHRGLIGGGNLQMQG